MHHLCGHYNCLISNGHLCTPNMSSTSIIDLLPSYINDLGLCQCPYHDKQVVDLEHMGLCLELLEYWAQEYISSATGPALQDYQLAALIAHQNQYSCPTILPEMVNVGLIYQFHQFSVLHSPVLRCSSKWVKTYIVSY